jgi:hypothetical protein
MGRVEAQGGLTPIALPDVARGNLLVENRCSRCILAVRPHGLGLLLPLRRGGPVARVRRESHVADARRSLQEPRGPSFSRTLNLPIRLPLARSTASVL